MPLFPGSRRGGHIRKPPAPVDVPDRSPAPEPSPIPRPSPYHPPAVPPTAPGTADGQEWSPIVVDIPTTDFEPRPANSREYVPDTIFDGWSTDHFTVRLASVRGYSHRYRGTPRQDQAEVVIHPQTGTCIFAVADGVSSAQQSHAGASAACRTAISVLRWQLQAGHPATDWNLVIDETARALTRAASQILRERDPAPEAVEALVATTLTTGRVVPGPDGTATVSLVQIGDSGAWLLQADRYYPMLAPKNDPHAPVLSSAVTPLPRKPSPLMPLEFACPPDCVLLIGTDGFGDPLGSGEGQVGRLFAEHLSYPPPPRGFAHLLDFSRETFDDDRTLVAIWPRLPQPGAA
jgi:Protein phosphatase 2C